MANTLQKLLAQITIPAHIGGFFVYWRHRDITNGEWTTQGIRGPFDHYVEPYKSSDQDDLRSEVRFHTKPPRGAQRVPPRRQGDV